MRILLLTENRGTVEAYRRASEERSDVRLGTVKNIPQALECLFRIPYDALLSEESAILHPLFQSRPVLWPNNLFLLLQSPINAAHFPETLTYCFLPESKPSDVLSFINTFPKGQSRPNGIDVAVSRYLQWIGVPVSLYGFSYLAEAIRLLLMSNRIADIERLNDLYDILSEETGVSSFAIEHAMRHAINTAWIRADTRTLETIFGYTVDAERAAPSNAAFIFRAADHLNITSGEGK